MTTQTSARVVRHFDLPAERVFDAWLDPEELAHWMFGPQVRDEEIVRLSLEARAGGSFAFVVRRQGKTIEHVGDYLEIDRPRRLVFTWSVAPSPRDSSRVTVEIAPAGTGSDLTLSHELAPGWEAQRAQIEQSWSRMLDALAKTFAQSV